MQQSWSTGLMVQRQPSGVPSAPPKQTLPDMTPVREALVKVEANWNLVASVSKGSPLAAEWVKRGEEVMVLIREHTAKAVGAIQNNDSALAKGYTSLLETDLIAYQYVSWNAFLYQNLGRIQPWVEGLSDSFKADKRDFTGRKQAEEAVQALKELVAVEVKDSAARLAKITTNVTFKLKSGLGADVAVRLTSAGDKSRREYMQDESGKIQKVEAAVELSVDYTNKFLDTAFEQGLEQAGEAVVEFYITKGALQKVKSKKTGETTPEPQETADVGPHPIPAPETEKRRKRRKKCKDICGETLPIIWPGFMPPPGQQRPLVRTPSNDDYIEPDRRSQPQRKLQQEISEQRDRHRSGKPGAYVPRPCFKNDADPNDVFDAHHMHPLYLGGAEDEINLCSLRTDLHQRAHPALNDQKVMFTTDPTWIHCKVCSAHLPDHLALQQYEIFAGAQAGKSK
jgi:hypothetical protein